jgi:trans-2-enoyl-CoA reductase
MENVENNPYKKEEYQAFIKNISEGNVSYWSKIAEALNVENDTITRWKKLPEAQAAIQKGIDKCLKEMETSGSKDWRMWHEKLKILNVQATQKLDLTSKGERIPLLGGVSINGFFDNDSNQEDTSTKEED